MRSLPVGTRRIARWTSAPSVIIRASQPPDGVTADDAKTELALDPRFLSDVPATGATTDNPTYLAKAGQLPCAYPAILPPVVVPGHRRQRRHPPLHEARSLDRHRLRL